MIQTVAHMTAQQHGGLIALALILVVVASLVYNLSRKAS